MVKITVLLENTKESSYLKSKHGLSLYIQTPKHKILFDMGPNDLFIKNAKKLGVDIANVDIAIISHGHVDHVGGLKYFLENNKNAKIYIRPQAYEKHLVKVFGLLFNVGIKDPKLLADRVVFSDDIHVIDDEVMLISNVVKDFTLPKSNNNLYVKKGNKLILDDFSHEQNLLIKSNDSNILISGCAHLGIVNIVNHTKSIINTYPDVVIGGMHLFEPTRKRYESDEYINAVANSLNNKKTSYYACHCTGIKAYNKMKNILENNITYLHTGSKLEI